VARRGTAGRGMARQGKAITRVTGGITVTQILRCLAWQGGAWQGGARQGVAGLGKAITRVTGGITVTQIFSDFVLSGAIYWKGRYNSDIEYKSCEKLFS